MAFRPGRKKVEFADLKNVLAQSKEVEGPLYQVVQEIIDRLITLTFVEGPVIEKGSSGGGGGGGASVNASYLTKNDETSTLPKSIQFLARYGLKFDDSLVTKRLIDLDLEYLGTYAAGPLYSDGDVVIGPDNIAYLCVRPTNNAPTPWPGTGIPSPPPVNDATYWTATPHAGLSNEIPLNSLANGFVKSIGGYPATVDIISLADGGTGNSLIIAPAGQVLSSNGANVTFQTGINIPQLNADALVAGQVNPARLQTFLGTVNNWNAQQNFDYTTWQGQGARSPTILAPSPRLNFYETDQGTDKHYKILMVDGETFFFQSVNDIYSTTLKTFASISTFGMVLGGAGENPIYAVGTNLTALNGSNITVGLIAPQRLGNGTPDANSFLRGDSQWVPIPSGIPSGLIALFESACPIGWTRFSALDGRFPRGAASSGATGGSTQHQHSFNGTTSGNGGHLHGANLSLNARFSATVFGRTQQSNGSFFSYDGGSSNRETIGTHDHLVSIDLVNIPVTGNATGNTDSVGDHTHSISGPTSADGDYPPFRDMVYCRKD